MYEHLKGKKLTDEDKIFFEDWILRKRKLSEIEKIINLEIFKKKPELLTPSVFFKKAEEIEEIVNLEIFEKQPELLTPSVFLRKAEEIEEIVNLEIFERKPQLLTSKAFLRKAEEIEKIINLELFEKYPHLLKAIVFDSLPSDILSSYYLYEYYKLQFYISSSHLALKVDNIYQKKRFLEEQFNPLTIETSSGKIKLNPIFLMSNKNMKINYGISQRELKIKYDYNISEEKKIIDEKVKKLIKNNY